MKLRLIALVLIGMAISGGCLSPAAPAVIDITLQQAFDLTQKNQGQADFVIVDVRTPAEYDSGHITGAVNIDIYEANFRQEIGKLARTGTYLVYCRTGNRSRQASDIMLSLGFQSVYNMTSGFAEWQAAGFPTVIPAAGK